MTNLNLKKSYWPYRGESSLPQLQGDFEEKYQIAVMSKQFECQNFLKSS